MEISTEFAKVMHAPITTAKFTAHVEAVKLLRSSLPGALKEWSELLQDMDDAYLENKASGRDKSCSIEQPLPGDYEKLSVWLSDSEKARDKNKSGNVNGESVDGTEKPCLRAELMSCSWCGRPSAALRKCGGCESERYVFAL